MKKILATICCILFINLFCQSQPGQLSISRVDRMPDMPSPYDMRDWKKVAFQYDAFIFGSQKSGQHLPLVNLHPAGYNFPEIHPILLKTYVGAQGSSQAEAINIIPAIIGASLIGVDKSKQLGVNWVEKVKEFYNSRNGQNVYLNGYNTLSGSDWWYDLMPNVFFYQLYNLYPSVPGFEEQFISVADRWLEALYAMGAKTTPWAIPEMHYRGWYLSSMEGNSEGVKEPESAGSISWLLYHAYRHTGEKKYLEGALLSMDFLSQLNSNPSYELQLPYGTLTAAKLNAEFGSDYPIGKMLEWSFEKGELRGWGTIVGKWDGQDVSGIIGEANDNGNDYAFMMNGYQQAAALVPLVKYDKRYARAIAKWTLNMANASRLFYPKFLDATKQDDLTWSTTYDPESVIGYEAIKENWEGKALYGTGDAKRSGWAETNLALYGSSHVGYLAAIVEPTEVEGILKLDLHKTDFFADHTFPSFLFYNPHPLDHQVTLQLGSSTYDIYDAISETELANEASGDIQVWIKAGEVILLSYLPAGTEKSIVSGKLFGNGHIIDHHYGYNFDPVFHIKSFTSEDSLMEFNKQASIYALIEHAPEAVVFNWYVNDNFYSSTSQGRLDWTTAATEGEYEIRVEILSGAQTLKDSLSITLQEQVPSPPLIKSVDQDQKFYLSGSDAKIICNVAGTETEKFIYSWNVSSGTFAQQDSLLSWTVPDEEGIYTISCVVKNVFGQKEEAKVKVLVKKEKEGPTAPLAYYPFNNNVNDYSGNSYHASSRGTGEAADALGNPASALNFSSGEDIVFVENKTTLNFKDAITLSFWISAGNASHEVFILSHGSWEERWKVSITPERKLRWTLKTDIDLKDLDSSVPLALDQYYHVTVVYSGYSMEIYLDGTLDSYLEHSGLILPTNKILTMGQKGVDETQFHLNGILDEVRIYDQSLNPDEIEQLKTLWSEGPLSAPKEYQKPDLKIFPNPSKGGLIHLFHPDNSISEVHLIDLNGKRIPVSFHSENSESSIKYDLHRSGLFILKLVMANETFAYKIILH